MGNCKAAAGSPGSLLDDAVAGRGAADVDGLLPGAPQAGAIHVVVPRCAGRGEPLRGFQALQRRQALGHGVLQVPGAPLPTAGAPAQGRRLLASDNVQSLLTQEDITTST